MKLSAVHKQTMWLLHRKYTKECDALNWKWSIRGLMIKSVLSKEREGHFQAYLKMKAERDLKYQPVTVTDLSRCVNKI